MDFKSIFHVLGFLKCLLFFFVSSGINAQTINPHDHSAFHGSGFISTPNGVLVGVGGTGLIQGQLQWDSTSDLDIHLTLPDGQKIDYTQPSKSIYQAN